MTLIPTSESGSPAPEGVRNEILRRVIAVLESREEVLEAYLFGSQATGRAQAHSEIDIAVYIVKRPLDERPYGDAAHFGKLLIAATRRDNVDVVILDDTDIVSYHRVLRDGIRLLARDLRATTRRDKDAYSRYFDYLPQLAKIESALREHRRD